MNKSELIETVAGTAGLEKKKAEAAVHAFVDSVVAKMKSGEQVSIFGFGTFKPTARAARMGRNPQTGAAVKIAASKNVKFQPSAAFKSALNTRGTKKAAAKKATVTKAAPAKKAATSAKKSVAPAAKAAPAKKSAAPVTKTAAPAKSSATPVKSSASTVKKLTATVKKAPAAKKTAPPAKKVAAAKKR